MGLRVERLSAEVWAACRAAAASDHALEYTAHPEVGALARESCTDEEAALRFADWLDSRGVPLVAPAPKLYGGAGEEDTVQPGRGFGDGWAGGGGRACGEAEYGHAALGDGGGNGGGRAGGDGIGLDPDAPARGAGSGAGRASGAGDGGGASWGEGVAAGDGNGRGVCSAPLETSAFEFDNTRPDLWMCYMQEVEETEAPMPGAAPAHQQENPP